MVTHDSMQNPRPQGSWSLDALDALAASLNTCTAQRFLHIMAMDFNENIEKWQAHQMLGKKHVWTASALYI